MPIADYDPSAFPPFAVTVDLVVLTVHDGVCNVLLVERGGFNPDAGMLSLAGVTRSAAYGHVRPTSRSPML